MAYIYGQRMQHMLLPSCIDEYVTDDDPVRVYDAFINELDFTKLGIRLDPFKGGPDEYEPRTMLKIIVYGYSNGLRSSRKLELACHRDISFMWLTGKLMPDYRTIARFRKEHAEAIHRVLREVVRLCIKWDIVEGNALFVDSTAMEANASLRKTFTPENIKERLASIDAHIDRLLKETARLDHDQEQIGSLAKVREELLNIETIRAGMREVEDKLQEESLTELNTTDRDSVRIKSQGRCRAGYKAQVVVDDKHGLIVNTDVVASASDMHQLSRQVENAVEVLEKSPQVVVSDSGYASVDDAIKVDEAITVVMPSQQQVAKERAQNKKLSAENFKKDKFQYDATSDSYTCPAGQKLSFRSFSIRPNGMKLKHYLPDAGVCAKCEHFGRCTKNPQGRKVTRHNMEHVKERIVAIYQSSFGQKMYKRRKILSELPHAWIKHNHAVRRFLLRGLRGVNTEFALLATAHNITRMITILGVTGLLAKLRVA